MDKRNLIVRSLSGIVYVGLIIGAILWGAYGLAILTSLFAIGASYELEKNVAGRSDDSKWAVTWVVDAAMLVALMWTGVFWTPNWINSPFFIWVLLLCFRFILQIFIVQPNPVKSIACCCLSQFYIGVPLLLFSLLPSFIHDPWIIICAIAMIWINDSGAYLVGCTIGKHRMFPRLSPKKSWEGFLGGLIFNIGAAFIFFYCFILNSLPFISNVQGWIFIGICVSALATLGDLFESMMKRSLGIKDFGSVIPGHGGILDRIDSLLFVVPGVLLLCLIASDMFLPV